MNERKTEEKLKTLWDGILPDGETAERLRKRVTDGQPEASGKTHHPGRRAGRKDGSDSAVSNRMRIPAAACLLLAFGMSGILLFGSATGPHTYTFTTDRGETLTFPPVSAVDNMSIDPGFPVVSRPLTAAESKDLFGTVSVTRGEYPLANDDLVWRGGSSYGGTDTPDFSNGLANDDLVWRQADPDSQTVIGELPDSRDAEYVWTEAEGADLTVSSDGEALSAIYGTFREDSGELIRAEGKLGETKITAAAPGITVTDAATGAGDLCLIDGYGVTLGSFTASPDSRGERTVIFSASFPMTVTDVDGETEWNVTAEMAGNADDPDPAAEALVDSVRKILSSDHAAARNDDSSAEAGE